MVGVNGLIVDARWMPPEVQAEAHRLGLIPDPFAAEPGERSGAEPAQEDLAA